MQTYHPPRTARLNFDKHELGRLIGLIRSGDADGAIAELQRAADNGGVHTQEVFAQAKTLERYSAAFSHANRALAQMTTLDGARAS